MQTLKRFTLVWLSLTCFLLQAASQSSDSILFLKTKAAYTQFELQHGAYIQTQHVYMHYLSWGTPGGIPLVWIHGSHGNAYEFYGYADSLVKIGYRVIAIDYYGHGLTPIPAKEVSIYHVADDVRFLLDHLKIKKAIIGGFSRGGSIATAFYDAYPGYVAGIILEDGGSVAWPTADHRKSIDSMSAIIKNEFQQSEQYPKPDFDSEYAAVKELANLQNEGSAFFALASLKQNGPGKWIQNPGLEEFFGENSASDFLRILYTPFASTQLFSTSTALLYPKIIYRNLGVPLLILDPVADNDRFDFEADNAQLQKAHPRAITHKVYKNTGHGLKFQRPKEFLSDVSTFLVNLKGFEKNK